MNTYKLKWWSFLHPVPTLSISLLSIWSLSEVILTSSFLFLKRIYLVLDAFKDRLFALKQSSILEISKFAKSYKSCKLFKESCSVVSSAKRIVKNFDALGGALIRIRNKIGPNIGPCGTPQEISLSEESAPLIEVNCLS